MNGKEKCKKLKEIRKAFAQANNIPYEVTECHYKGNDCLGTCPKCEEELAYINNAIKALSANDIEVVYPDIPVTSVERERPAQSTDSSDDSFSSGDSDFHVMGDTDLFLDRYDEKADGELSMPIDRPEIDIDDDESDIDEVTIEKPRTLMGMQTSIDDMFDDDEYDEFISSFFDE